MTRVNEKIIDFHIHLFPPSLFKAIWQWFSKHAWEIKYQLEAHEAVLMLKKMGVLHAVVLNYAHKPNMSKSLNRWTYDFCQSEPMLIPFGTVHPEDEDVLEVLKQVFDEFKFQGLKLHTHVTGIPADDLKMYPIYEVLEEKQKILMLHAGSGPSLPGYPRSTKKICDASRVEKILRTFPRLKLIIPHLGFDEFEDYFVLMDQYPNLWMDTCMTLSQYFPQTPPLDKIFQFSNRILYGSDFPNLPYEASREMDVLQEIDLPGKVKKDILYHNACRLLGMDKKVDSS